MSRSIRPLAAIAAIALLSVWCVSGVQAAPRMVLFEEATNYA